MPYDFVFVRGVSVFSVFSLSHSRATADVETLSVKAKRGLSERGIEVHDASGPITLDGEARTVSFGFEAAETAAVSHGEQVIAVRDGVVYVVTLAAPRGSYSRGDFEPLLSGWRWSS